ncbi:MAG: MFS transporter, partial [Lachnospiraceae bacterium]|nr:MFS transporter [Lachnospiraceae bacterium]
MSGLARGLGSASFAVTSMIIGGVVEKRGVSVLLWVNIVTMIVSVIVVYIFRKPETEADADGQFKPETDAKEVPKGNSMAGFLRAYPAFMLFLLAAICFFFAHNMINDFMIRIINEL